MDTRARIKSVLAAENTTLKSLVGRVNERHPEKPTTAQNVTNKMAKRTIRFDEVSEMMDILGYDVVIRRRTDGWEC
ncbi:MAG: hypothetical protein IJ682_04720 [Lachnospiraceae bacterium]|nr:hypothetical protein [Lachnospiraceae bacterium]